eukprot:TRINITY_DN1146_c2_g1_i1.p1 TRINITY_DN1146_c2_g1~~TRINITY_DN1146_c2_g1_i1.p1  ORF type:complete len:100 (-),score=17.45 TRINITY_DN1146_c2_g1_i1:56-355(-)
MGCSDTLFFQYVVKKLLKSNQIRLLEVPPIFRGKNYGVLFSSMMLNNDLVCIGLYRRNVSSETHYVVTNPNHDTRLKTTDRVYVLNNFENTVFAGEGGG